ncbi:SEA (Seh1-associated) complex subunit [Coemansia sp. RSA 552]|nr:SEA (Seh1-associated) complex subunit [Coemansia sp. RSA 552]
MSNRRSGGRASKKKAAAAAAAAANRQQKLETLPEIPTDEADEAPRPETAPGKVSAHAAGGEQQSRPPAAEGESSQRPRSRTASPWRGRGRGAGSIFARSSNPRSHMNRQSIGLSSGHDSNDSPQGPTSPVRISSARVSGPNSAGPAPGRSHAADPAEHSSSSGHRRRGHTLDPEQLAVRQMSPAGISSEPAARTAIDTSASTSDGRKVMSATASHFHVKMENASLSAHHPHLASPKTPVGRPARLSKADSASSGATVTTVEIEESPTLSRQSSAALPQGQLSKMLYREQPQDAGEDGHLFIDTAAASAASGGSAQQTGVSGRPRRGGSGGESRFGDYKSALGRQSTQSVFGSRPRHGAGGQPVDMVSALDESGQHMNMAFSGPVEIPGISLRSNTDTGMRQSQDQLGNHGPRNGRSSGDDMRERTGPGTGGLRRISSKDTLDIGRTQQSRQQQQGQPGRGAWLHTSPGERSDVDSAEYRLPVHQPTPHLARMPKLPLQGDFAMGSDYPYTAGGYGLATDRRNSHAIITEDQVRQMHGSVGQPSATSPGDDADADGRYGAGSFGDGRSPSNSRGREPRLLPATIAMPGTESVNPWSAPPSAGRRGLLRLPCPGRWNALAVSPDTTEPICAVAGHEGLLLRSASSTRYLHSGRRWTQALDLKDVLWRPLDHVVTGASNGTIGIWDPSRDTEHIVRRYTEFSRPVSRLAFRPGDPNFFYSAFSDGNIIGWDMRVDSRVPALRMSIPLTLRDVHSNPQDPNGIAAMSENGRITIWDTRKPQDHKHQFIAHTAFNGQCLAWHPNGRFIASGSSDQNILIWDVKSMLKKVTSTAFCSIKTSSHVHRLQWRPGHDTQITSCAFLKDRYLQVWDMTNPHRNLMFHDKHSESITGFAWFDEDVVCSVGRNNQIVMCDMQSDAIYTDGLLAKTVADFSPNTRLSVATGTFSPGTDTSADASWSRNTQRGARLKSTESVATVAADSSSEGANTKRSMSKFQPNLPEAFIDEHMLDSSMTVKSESIRYLARNYRYDPNNFRECCEANAQAATTVGQIDIAKFWQFLAAAFGDMLPLKPRRKVRRKPSGQYKQQDEQQEPAAAAGANAGVVASVATSRSSSGMFPSKSVIDVLSPGDSSDEEPHRKHIGGQIMRHSTNASPARVQANMYVGSLGITFDGEANGSKLQRMRPGVANTNGGAGKLERTFMSLSHSNLQQAGMVATSKGRVPSPLSRPAAHSMSLGPPGHYASEPATPAHSKLNQSVFQSFTTNPNLTTEAVQRNARYVGLSRDSSAHHTPRDLDSQSMHSQQKFFFHDDTPVEIATTPVQTRRPTFAFGSNFVSTSEPAVPEEEPAKPISGTQRRAAKADLKLVAESCLYYADKGDVQTALIAALLMRRFIRLKHWPEARTWFVDYIDQLDRYEEYSAATEILLETPFDDIQEEVQNPSIINISCSQCGSRLQADPIDGFTRCVECESMANSCAICEIPVIGRYVWCETCGHGGHFDHMHEWFEEMKETACPSGCGHACRVNPVDDIQPLL